MAKKVLLVDDEDQILGSLKIILENSGYNVITASGGEEGLNKALTEKPDLIILDLFMPKVDGYGVLVTLRQRKARIAEDAPHIKSYKAPVIVLTAHGDERIRELIEKEEVAVFLEKPIEPQKLLAEIKNALERFEEN